MIDLYTWTTPNGRKASIMLEEIGLPYTVHPVDIGKDEQFKPEFLKISPNNRIPAIVDRDTGIALMESAALMIYLADKTGKLLPKEGEPRYRALEWLEWQMGGPGPIFGQVHHFVKYNKGKAPYAEERFSKEAHRLYGVLDRRLAGRDFVADTYSIADIAIWPWVSRYEWQEVDLNKYPNVKRWYVAIANAAGGAEGLQGAEGRGRGPPFIKKEKENKSRTPPLRQGKKVGGGRGWGRGGGGTAQPGEELLAGGGVLLRGRGADEICDSAESWWTLCLDASIPLPARIMSIFWFRSFPAEIFERAAQGLSHAGQGGPLLDQSFFRNCVYIPKCASALALIHSAAFAGLVAGQRRNRPTPSTGR